MNAAIQRSSTDTLPSHLFVSVDGDLYRTDRPGWHKGEPVRRNYSRTHGQIKTVADLKATLRAGRFAWPGGYPLYFLTDDGAALSFGTVRREFRLVADAIRRDSRNGWRVVATDVNWEDTSLVDAHTNETIESAYGKEQN